MNDDITTVVSAVPKFSVIIPLYNKAAYIAETIQSVLDQTYSNFELIIIDDGSTDHSASVIQTFDDVRISYFYQKNQGVSTARNYGISLAKGDYIAFLDADDYWFPFFLNEINALTHQFPDEKVFALAIERQFGTQIITPTYSVTHPISCIDYFEGSQHMSLLTTSSTVLQTSIFEEVASFDPKLVTTEDIDLWIRIGLKSLVVFNTKIGVRYIDTPKSLTNSVIPITQKSRYDQFKQQEVFLPFLKLFLNQNRFAMMLESSIQNDRISYTFYKNEIDDTLLNIKQKLLLKCPSQLVRFLFVIKNWLHKNGIHLSIFK